MAVFKVNKKRDHTKVNMFLDGNVDLQRFDVLKYKQFDKLTDKLLTCDEARSFNAIFTP